MQLTLRKAVRSQYSTSANGQFNEFPRNSVVPRLSFAVGRRQIHLENPRLRSPYAAMSRVRLPSECGTRNSKRSRACWRDNQAAYGALRMNPRDSKPSRSRRQPFAEIGLAAGGPEEPALAKEPEKWSVSELFCSPQSGQRERPGKSNEMREKQSVLFPRYGRISRHTRRVARVLHDKRFATTFMIHASDHFRCCIQGIS
jgi:hypothetical protein